MKKWCANGIDVFAYFGVGELQGIDTCVEGSTSGKIAV